MATERVAFERFIPNSPRKLSVPTAVFSMTIMPFMNDRASSSSAPFDSRLPVVSRPMWRVYDVRSNSWSAPPKTISTCSTELRSPSSRLSTRLRTSRDPSWASAQWSVAPSPMTRVPVLERDGRGGQLLEAGDRRARASRRGVTSERPGEERLAGRRARPRPTATSSSRTVASAPSPSAMIVRVRSARSGAPARPADDDRPREPDAGRDVEDDALAPAARGSAGRTGRRRAGSRRRRAARGRAPGRARARSAERRRA